MEQQSFRSATNPNIFQKDIESHGERSHRDSVDHSVQSSNVFLSSHFRNKLQKLFVQIEHEFEKEYRKLYLENLALQERLDKYEDVEHEDGTGGYSKKSSGIQLSQKLKHQYKQSASRLVSTLRSGATAQQTFDSGITGSTCWKHRWRVDKAHKDGIWEVSILGKLVGTASADSTVKLWNSETGGCLLNYIGHSGSVNSIRFRSKDCAVLTASGDGAAHIFTVPLELSSTFISSGSTQSGKESTSGLDDDLALTNPFETPQAAFDDKTVMCIRNPDATFQSASFLLPSSEEARKTFGSVQYPPTSTYSCSFSSNVLCAGEPSPLAAADFLLSRNQIVTASWDRVARIYDEVTGQEVSTLTGHDQSLTDICCNYALAVTSSRDTTFRLWDFRSTSTEVHIQQGHNQVVNTARFLGDTNCENVVSVSADKFCKIWDLRHWRLPVLSIRTDAPINRLGVHPDGKIFAFPLDNRHVRFYDINGNRLGRLPRTNTLGHSRMVSTVTWQCGSSPIKSDNLFTAGFDQALASWQVRFNV